jgi:hypothetical protein
MIRISYQQTLEPATVHHYLVTAGVVPTLYIYRPRTDIWTLHIPRADAVATRRVLTALGIEFTEISRHASCCL